MLDNSYLYNVRRKRMHVKEQSLRKLIRKKLLSEGQAVRYAEGGLGDPNKLTTGQVEFSWGKYRGSHSDKDYWIEDGRSELGSIQTQGDPYTYEPSGDDGMVRVVSGPAESPEKAERFIGRVFEPEAEEADQGEPGPEEAPEEVAQDEEGFQAPTSAGDIASLIAAVRSATSAVNSALDSYYTDAARIAEGPAGNSVIERGEAIEPTIAYALGWGLQSGEPLYGIPRPENIAKVRQYLRGRNRLSGDVARFLTGLRTQANQIPELQNAFYSAVYNARAGIQAALGDTMVSAFQDGEGHTDAAGAAAYSYYGDAWTRLISAIAAHKSITEPTESGDNDVGRGRLLQSWMTSADGRTYAWNPYTLDRCYSVALGDILPSQAGRDDIYDWAKPYYSLLEIYELDESGAGGGRMVTMGGLGLQSFENVRV
jgi:hypothetical protein